MFVQIWLDAGSSQLPWQECSDCCPGTVCKIYSETWVEVAKRWEGSGERPDNKEQGQSEHEIPVRLVQVANRLTKLGKKQGMDC